MSFLDTTGPVAKDQWIYRQRSDDPDVLHYVTAKGIEGTGLFKDDTDRHSFLERLACILDETQTQCYSWALIPDQFHLLLQTDPIPLSKVMHRLMTGYAVTFNKRHRRSGYLFESRHNSISYENDGCLLDLIRYIHLIPFQAKVVRDIDDLDKYPWSGLSGILDYHRNPLIPEIRGQAPRDRQTASKRT